MLSRRVSILIFVLWWLCQPADLALAQHDFSDPAVRELRRSLMPQADGSHLLRLLSLRTLEDAALEPLFDHLSQHESWLMQVHGVLGLAELDSSRCIDPKRILDCDARAREAILANAIDLEILCHEARDALLKDHKLEPIPEMLLMGEAALAGHSLESSKLESYLRDDDLRIASFAGVLLAANGSNAGLKELERRVLALPARQQPDHWQWILDALHQYECTASIPWIQEQIRKDLFDRDTRYWSIHCIISLDVRVGLHEIRNALRDDDSNRNQIQLGTLLLEAADDLPPEAYLLLTGEHPLIDGIQNLGQAIANGQTSGDAYCALLRLGHVRTSNLILDRFDHETSDIQDQICRFLLDESLQSDLGRPEKISQAISVLNHFCEVAPDRILQWLLEAEDDSLEQEIILMAILNDRAPWALDPVRSIRRIGTNRADSLALLVIARNAEELQPEELEQLSLLASGGGRISVSLQMQAAWLHIKHSGRADMVLPAIIDGASNGDR